MSVNRSSNYRLGLYDKVFTLESVGRVVDSAKNNFATYSFCFTLFSIARVENERTLLDC